MKLKSVTWVSWLLQLISVLAEFVYVRVEKISFSRNEVSSDRRVKSSGMF